MIVPVIGVNRSGTSLVAQILAYLGVDMGDDILAPDDHNKTGYWEDMDFLNLNKEIYSEVSCDWWEVPDTSKVSYYSIEDIKNLINKKNEQGKMWGWKDPRTLQLWMIYHNILQNYKNVKIVLVRRNFKDVRKSLETAYREHDYRKLIKMGQSNIDRILKGKEYEIHQTFYNDLIDNPQGEIKKLADFLGVHNKEDLTYLVKPELKHHG